MLEAFKQLHDSKKRGTQSLADVPVEHLAKAGWKVWRIFAVLDKCLSSTIWARDGKGDEETVLSADLDVKKVLQLSDCIAGMDDEAP